MTYALINHGKYKITKLREADTIEILIFPPNKEFLDKDFLFRISTARMYKQLTEFTHLPSFNRQLILLYGKNRLEHYGDGVSCTAQLNLLDLYIFSGGDKTLSYGPSEDFNLIVKNNYPSKATLKIIKHNESLRISLREHDFCLIYTLRDLIDLEIIPENTYLADSITIEKDNSLLICQEEFDVIFRNAIPASSKTDTPVSIACFFSLPIGHPDIPAFKKKYLT